MCNEESPKRDLLSKNTMTKRTDEEKKEEKEEDRAAKGKEKGCR